MKKYIVAFGVIGVVISLFVVAWVHASFTSGALNTNNSFTAAAVFPTATPSATPTPTAGPIPTGIATHVVISEVQINGGPSHADYDFIELYNPTAGVIDVNGYRLVSRTGNSSSDDLIKSFTVTTNIPAHGFYLWASSHDSAFPASIGADTSTTPGLTSSMSIALRNGPSNTGTIIDALSWNNGATIGEGTNVTPPDANQSLERKAYSTSTVASMTTGADVSKGNGYDSNDNSIDFILRPVSQPQNSTSSIEIP